ncbi:MAG TPA: hypothetical protein VHX20_02115 [Terracidiphilus sp.]|jgi:hypothetical protein|nr:hypothetical protein [Terracidiphilus sp.]
MLDDVIANYIDSLTEREFDAPFKALLRLHGFFDIHFLHGSFEFGKDFIAKRNEDGSLRQYAFQTKAGDIGITEWNLCRGQIDMLRTDSLSHPNFDKQMRRAARFVTTGRLVGGAALAAQQYGQRLASLGETGFLTWDRDTLVEMLATDPRSLSGSPISLLQILGSQNEDLGFSELERHSRGWIRSANSTLNLRDSLEAAVIANHCRRQNRIDLASWTALMLLRSTLATAHSQEPIPDSAEVALSAARAMFEHYAGQLWSSCQGKFLNPDEIIIGDNNPAAYVTYPVRCVTIIEILSLLGWLYADAHKDEEKAQEIAGYLCKFVEANLGASHPVSDRWGISLAPAVLLLSKNCRTQALSSLIRSTIKWIADRYDEGSLGLAGPHATPMEEVEFLLGSPFEHVAISRRSESFNASIVLDLTCVLEEPELFELARNEFLAVDIFLPVIEMDDDQGQYCLHVGDYRFEPNMPFEEYWRPIDGWKNSPHHRRGNETLYPERVGYEWDQLAISCVLRDRYFVKGWRRLLGRSA